MYKSGDSVVLTNAKSIAKFGPGPFEIVRVLPGIRAVELDDVGTVDISEISLANAAPVVTDSSVLQKKTLATPNREDSSRRIEAIAGSLLAHNDANVRMAAKEILRLVWEK